MANSNKGSRTREQIIGKATLLFTQNGYNRTSLRQILMATGLTKGGFYFHFPSKEELGMAVIQALEDCWSEEILPKVSEGRDATEKLDLMFAAPGDCCFNAQRIRPTLLLMNLATEMVEVNDKFSKRLRQIFDGWWIMIEKIISDGQEEHIFKPDIDAKIIAAIILSNIIGANLLSLLNGETLHYQKQLDTLKSVLYNGIAI